MSADRVFFVHLRRPGKNDSRPEPFYEFGSFGCTGCHSNNLLHANNVENLEGARLAFAQGGHLGFRLVFLTPPVTVVRHASVNEVKWTPAEMPFRYECAPVLVSNDQPSDFSLVRSFANRTQRTTIEGGFSSRIRSLATALPPKMAAQVIEVYETFRATCESSSIAKQYWEALPYHNTVESKLERKQSYRKWQQQQSKQASTQSGTCNVKPNKLAGKC